LTNDTQIAASGVAVDLFLQNDVLTHPSANLRYDLNDAASQDFFNIQTYRKLQNVADQNPIATLKLLRDKTKTDTINANTFAQTLNPNFSVNNIRALIYEMVASIRFYSESNGTNAKLNISNNEIVVDQVSTIEFSDRQKVAAKPYKKQLVLKKNRNLSFDGKIFAGHSSFEGKDLREFY